jgi:hypothetical protein
MSSGKMLLATYIATLGGNGHRTSDKTPLILAASELRLPKPLPERAASGEVPSTGERIRVLSVESSLPVVRNLLVAETNLLTTPQ